MLNRGFGTSLFNMVPKGWTMLINEIACFGTSLFSMVPKVVGLVTFFARLFWN